MAEGKNLRKQDILQRRLQKMHALLLSLQKAIRLAASAAAVAGALVLFSPQTAGAQTFELQSGALNPLNSVSIYETAPAFTDIDGDGDMDVFIGTSYGTVFYYKNTGNNVSPVFTEQTGYSNPFDGLDIGSDCTPAFADIDDDGDMDAVLGDRRGRMLYYKNTGTSLAPVFELQTGADDPFGGIDLGWNSAPCFVDIDGDGDMDCFSGDDYGGFLFLKNTGTPAAPIFTLQTGVANPLNGIDLNYNSKPAFADLDADGDMDLITGESPYYTDYIRYFKNTGTALAAEFTEQTGTLNPFNGVIIAYATPAFVDIDNDADQDLFF